KNTGIDGEHDRCMDDTVYDCARYCGGTKPGSNCSNATAPPGIGVGFDCARCADSKAKRTKCGEVKRKRPIDVEIGLCHAGAFTHPCKKPKAYEAFYCDGSMKTRPEDVACCAECNEGDSPERTDLPCGPDPDTCTCAEPNTP